jgi:hypothetical protein
MTSLSISSSSAPAAGVSQVAANPAPSGTPPFSSFLQKSASEYDQPVTSVKAAPKQEASKPEKDSKPAKDETAHAAALTLLMPAQQQHLPLDTRSFSLALPKKEQTGKTSADARVTEDDEQGSGPVPGAASAIASKQQIAFGATIPAVPNASLNGSGNATINGSGNKIGSLAQQTEAAKTAAVDDKPSSGKQQHSGSSDSDNGASSQNATASDVVAAKSESSAPAQFSVPPISASGPAAAPGTIVEAAYSAAPAAKISQPEPVIHTAAVTEPAATTVSRPQNIELQSGDVNVRVSERGGEVQITVRTSDNDMAQSLRQHLPELSDKLTQTGIHADLWQPSTAQSAASGQDADSAPGRDAQNQQQSGTPDGEQSSEQQEQSHDDWQQEFTSAEMDDR